MYCIICFSIKKAAFCLQTVFLFHKILRMNNSYLPTRHKIIVSVMETLCFLTGRKSNLKYDMAGIVDSEGYQRTGVCKIDYILQRRNRND
jgi:hypothetical protein